VFIGQGPTSLVINLAGITSLLGFERSVTCLDINPVIDWLTTFESVQQYCKMGQTQHFD
jgi:hypothetical protein